MTTVYLFRRNGHAEEVFGSARRAIQFAYENYGDEHVLDDYNLAQMAKTLTASQSVLDLKFCCKSQITITPMGLL